MYILFFVTIQKYMDIIEQQLEGLAESAKTILVNGSRSEEEAERNRRKVDYAKYRTEEIKAVMEGNFAKASILHIVADNI